MNWQIYAFLPIFIGSLSYSSYKLLILYRMMKAHNGKSTAPTNIKERLITTFVNVLGQKAVLKDKKAGMVHATIFWGFIIITTGTIEQFISTIYPDFNLELVLGESAFSVLVFLQDFFTLAVLVAVLFAAYRRFIVKPPHLGQSTDANIILFFTGSLMISILLMNAFFILGLDYSFKSSMPISLYLSVLLSHIDLSTETQTSFGVFFKWVHMLIVLGFGMYIPSSKHLHVLAAGPNTFLKKLDRAKPMTTINFEDESLTQYGAAKVTDLSWKDALDYYSCTECGRCQSLCPAHNTGKPLSPKNLIIHLKENLYRNKNSILAGKYEEVTHIIDEKVTEDVIWACTSCRACEVACPVFIEHTDKIYEARRNLVMMESKFPAEVQTVFKNMETNGSPWAFNAQDRFNWAEGLTLQTAATNPSFDVLFWVGCAGAFDDRNKKVVRAFTSLLKKAGVKFAVLGTEETCTGDSARRIGNEYLFQTLAKTNIETLNKYNVKNIVTTCPHCFNTLKNEYAAFGGTYEVEHHSQFLARLIKEGKIRPTKEIRETITFHDSCYLGRWNNVYEQPRDILNAIPSTRLVEMKNHHDQSMCCGAGGGRMWMEETIGTRVNVTRTEQAIDTKAGIIASSCPFCMTMMTDGIKAKDMQDKMKVLDIAELLEQTTV